MIHQFFLDRRPHNGMTFEEYTEMMRRAAEEAEKPDLQNKQIEGQPLVKLNYQRFSRILRTYKIDPLLEKIVKNISTSQIWMIISEISCGDSSQNIPYIAKIAGLNPLISLRIILRDSNPDIMDHYLTNGTSRSIPKLVAFDESGNELFQWGARPAEAQALVDRLRSEGVPKEEFIEELHLWYGRDRGKTLENELKKIITSCGIA